MDKKLQKKINEAINAYFWHYIKNVLKIKISKAENILGLEPNRLHRLKHGNNAFYTAVSYYYFITLGIDRTALDEQIEQIIEEHHARIKSN